MADSPDQPLSPVKQWPWMICGGDIFTTRSAGNLLEGTVTLLVASPLLTIAGIYDPPFRVRTGESVLLTLDDSEEVLRAELMCWCYRNQFWVVVVESKKTAISAWAASAPGPGLHDGEPPPRKKRAMAWSLTGMTFCLSNSSEMALPFMMCRGCLPCLRRDVSYMGCCRY